MYSLEYLPIARQDMMEAYLMVEAAGQDTGVGVNRENVR